MGTARVEADPAVAAALTPDGCEARPEQAILFEVAAWDVSCPQHIAQEFAAADVAAAVAAALDQPQARVDELEAGTARLRQPQGDRT